jgi:hypothetical protein
MKSFTMALLVLLFAGQAAAETAATQVKVSWQNPDKYTDIRPSSGTKKAYQQRVINAFDKIWAGFAEKLPAGHTLQINVKDLDLAGDVNPMYRIDHNDIRVIKEIYFPRMTFDYQLSDATGKIVAAEQDVKIKDMNFMSSSNIGIGNTEFVYERQMIKSWLQRDLLPKLGMEK